MSLTLIHYQLSFKEKKRVIGMAFLNIIWMIFYGTYFRSIRTFVKIKLKKKPEFVEHWILSRVASKQSKEWYK